MRVHPTEVDFRDSLHPAQSAFVKTVISDGTSCHLNKVTSLGFATRYLPVLFDCSHDPSVGALIVLASSFTASDISGLSDVT